MKNEGWGIKEDQIPSSSHFYIKRWALNCIILIYVNALNLQNDLAWASDSSDSRSPNYFRTVSMDVSFMLFCVFA